MIGKVKREDSGAVVPDWKKLSDLSFQGVEVGAERD